MRILFATLTLFPYRVDWLSELGKEADVDIFYLSDTDKDRNHQWMSKRPDNCRYPCAANAEPTHLEPVLEAREASSIRSPHTTANSCPGSQQLEKHGAATKTQTKKLIVTVL